MTTSLLRTLWLIPALLVLGCSDRSPTTRPGAEGLAGAGGDVHDLAARLAFAELRCELVDLAVSSFEQRAYLRQGWCFPAEAKAGAPAPEALAADGRLAELVLHVAQPAEIVCTTAARGFVRRDEVNAGRVLLNGTEIARIALGSTWQELRLLLPAELQRPGENLLAFELEHARTAAEVFGGESTSGLRTSAHFRAFRFERTDPQAAGRVRWARARLPAGAGLRTLSADESALELCSTAALRYHLEVPRAARFRAGLAFVDSERESPAPARFRLVVTPRGGAPEVLCDELVPHRAPPRELDLSLERFAGTIARLALEVEGPDGSAAVGAWIAPRIVSAAVPAPAPPAAPALDGALRGAPVVAVLIDACRADVLSCYGGRPGLTPNIDRLAREGVLFERAHAVACYTMASVSSMLADRPTWEHGTYWESHRLPETFETWPERFRAEGYRTIAIAHSLNGSSRVGFERGFDEMIEVYRERSRRDREVVFAEEALPPLARVLAADDGRPLFLWLHLIEPHRPYDPPAPFRGRLSAGYAGALDGGVASARRIKNRELVPSDEDVAYLRAVYEENLAYVDAVLGDVRAALEAAGIFDEAIVCLFSDHGEAFLEHDGRGEAGIGHGATTYQEMNHVPLVFRLPARLGLAERRARALVSGLDILPTLGALTGVAAPAGGTGKSLTPLLADPLGSVRERALSHAYCARADRFLTMWAHWWGDYKLVHQGGALPALFDLRADPLERDNLLAREPILAAHLRQALAEELGFDPDCGERASTPSEEIAVNAEEMEMLRALGYVR